MCPNLGSGEEVCLLYSKHPKGLTPREAQRVHLCPVKSVVKIRGCSLCHQIDTDVLIMLECSGATQPLREGRSA